MDKLLEPSLPAASEKASLVTDQDLGRQDGTTQPSNPLNLRGSNKYTCSPFVFSQNPDVVALIPTVMALRAGAFRK